VAFFRAMMPALAGISRMPYRTFLVFNAAGGIVWGTGFTLLGYFAGAAYQKVERTAGTAVAVVVAVVVVAALVVWHVRRKRRENAPAPDTDTPGADTSVPDASAAEDAGSPEAGQADGGPADGGPDEDS
jgi:hypothetical protein